MPSDYAPDPKLKFTFGLWTVGNIGRDPFGGPVRDAITPAQICDIVGEVGAYGVNFHDNDLVPIDATRRAGATAIKREFKKALKDNGLAVPMATTNLFTDRGLQGRRLHQQQRPNPRLCHSEDHARRWNSAPSSAPRFTSSGAAAKASKADATKDPVEAIKRFREAINFLCEYSIEQKSAIKFAFEAKPNEPRGHIYFAVTGSYLAFIPTLDHPEMCGVNPEVAPRAHGGLEFRPPGGRRPRAGQVVPHRPERPGIRPIRSGFPLWPARTSSTLFSW